MGDYHHIAILSESNQENRKNPQIQTRKLTEYKIILAPKPIAPPTQRELRDGRRCRLSGMVPGAIRKYLLQKKKQQSTEEEEEEEEEDEQESDEEDEEHHNNNEDDDDEVRFVGDYSPSDEVDHGQECHVNGSTANTEDSDQGTFYDGTSEEESNNNKRSYCEAFGGLSPDTTTPEITASTSTSAAARSNRDREPTLEIVSSPVVLEVEQSPGKRIRLETTPKRKRGSRSGSDRDDVGPSRKGSKDAPGPAIEIDIPDDRRACVKQILQDRQESHYTLAPEDPDLEKKVQKNVWKAAISRFQANLENKQIPIPRHVGDLIKKAILGLGTRVSKDVQTAAQEFFTTLVKEYPVRGGDDSTEYYSSAFTQTTTNTDKCSMAEFLFDVLGRVHGDAQAGVQSKSLPFFKILTKMVVKQYKDYGASIVKLRRPFFVQFLEEQDRILSYNYYCKRLVKFTFLLKDYPEEFKTVMRWVGLLSYHLKKHSGIDNEFRSLVDDFVDTLSKQEYISSTCQIVQAICDAALGAAVSFKILTNRIKFKSVRDNSSPASDEDVAYYLRSLTKSDLMAGLKSDWKDRRHSPEYPTIPISSLVNANVRRSETPAVNLKGESFLHKLCKKVSPDSKDGSGLKLAEHLKRQRFATVNPTDHFGNTPLHDAIAHGRFDAVTKFYEFCVDSRLPEGLRVNVLAQNDAGDTPFHLAAISSDQNEQMSRMLIFIADKLQVKEEALKTLNQQGKMPYEMAFNPVTRSLLKPEALTEWNFQLGDVSVHPSSRSELQSLDTKKLILFWSSWCKQDK